MPEEIPTLHLVAAHEVRRSFPLDSISVKHALGADNREIVFPGVHSDVGGGYAPGEQGKGTDSQGSDMLSRIPLIYMYREARLAGVPLKLELAKPVTKTRFALAPSTIKAFNAYIAASQVRSGKLTAIMRDQRRQYIEWRALRRAGGVSSLEATASFNRATPFDQNDLHSANIEFGEEITAFEAWFKDKGVKFKPVSQQDGFDNEQEAEWEEIATWWRRSKPLAPEITNFFDDYLHDSRAWFKLFPGNPDNEDDLKAMLVEWENRRRATEYIAKNPPPYAGNPLGGIGYRPPVVGDGLTDEQRRAAAEFARTGKIPRLLTRGREPFRGAKAGYMRFRKVYAGGDNMLISQVPSNAEKTVAV